MHVHTIYLIQHTACSMGGVEEWGRGKGVALMHTYIHTDIYKF